MEIHEPSQRSEDGEVIDSSSTTPKPFSLNDLLMSRFVKDKIRNNVGLIRPYASVLPTIFSDTDLDDSATTHVEGTDSDSQEEINERTKNEQ